MYCILYLNTYIYHKHQPNVGKYTVRPMDPMGSDIFVECILFILQQGHFERIVEFLTFASKNPRIASD